MQCVGWDLLSRLWYEASFTERYVFSSCRLRLLIAQSYADSTYRYDACKSCSPTKVHFPGSEKDLQSRTKTQVRCRKFRKRKMRTASHFHLHETCRCRAMRRRRISEDRAWEMYVMLTLVLGAAAGVHVEEGSADRS